MTRSTGTAKTEQMDWIQGIKQGNLGFNWGKIKAGVQQIKLGLNNTMT